jgi:hypothetical protein
MEFPDNTIGVRIYNGNGCFLNRLLRWQKIHKSNCGKLVHVEATVHDVGLVAELEANDFPLVVRGHTIMVCPVVELDAVSLTST